MTSNKKLLILESFCNMNTSMLEVLLDDAKTYQDTSKELFIERVNEAFEFLKKEGNTKLNIFKGHCNSADCPNKDCNGYSFVGNEAPYHLDLIFTESQNDIEDIYHCNEFFCEDVNEPVYDTVEVCVGEDEKINFIPTTEYYAKKQQIEKALSEIDTHTILHKDIYLPWLEKHEELYRSINYREQYYATHNKFTGLHTILSSFKDIVEVEDWCKISVTTYYDVVMDKEMSVLKWLVHHETFYFDCLLYNLFNIDCNHDDFIDYNGIKATVHDFKNVIEFYKMYKPKYDEMMEKYKTYTDEEYKKLLRENKFPQDYFFLSYHLKQRGIM